MAEFELRIGHLPSLGDEGIYDVRIEQVRRKQWIHRLVRITRTYWIGHADLFLRTEMARCHVGETERKILVDYLKWSLSHADYSPDSPEQVASCVRNFISYWGEIPAPKWCSRPDTSSPRLWLACLLYGTTRKEFPFAEGRIAFAFGIPNKNSVRSFITSAIRHGLLQIVRKGSPIGRGGKATYYRLHPEYSDVLYQLYPRRPLPPNDYNTIPFWRYAAGKLDWLNDTVEATSR